MYPNTIVWARARYEFVVKLRSEKATDSLTNIVVIYVNNK